MMVRLSLLLALSMIACAAAPTPKPTPTQTLVIRDADRRIVVDASMAYTVRKGQRVVFVDGIGELLVDMKTGACRFVQSQTGLDLTMLSPPEGVACGTLTGDRMCFASVPFESAAGPRGVAVFTVDGCADQNALFLRDRDIDIERGIGPQTYVERCVPVPAKNPSYLRIDVLRIQGNRRPFDGARFTHDGDDFSLCFQTHLEQSGIEKTGRYEATVTVDDDAGIHAVAFEGDVADL
jgi:hypothetical protein